MRGLVKNHHNVSPGPACPWRSRAAILMYLVRVMRGARPAIPRGGRRTLFHMDHAAACMQ